MLTIKAEHTVRVEGLPGCIHNDPFDRLLIAQAQFKPLMLTTSDSRADSSAPTSCGFDSLLSTAPVHAQH